jgi:exopolysaccharide biosynthesis protein
MDPKYKKLLKNTAWILTGNTGSKMLAFLLLPLYTRWLGTEGYGLSDLISTYSGLLVGVITLCTAEGIFVFTKNKSVKEQKMYYTSTLKFTLFLFVVWAVVFLLLQSVVLAIDFHNAFTEHIWLVFGMVLSTFLQNYTQQFVISLEKMKIYSFTGMVLCITTFIFSWILIPKWGVEGYVFSLILANVFTSLYSFLASHSWKYLDIVGFRLHAVKNVLVYSIPLIPNTIMWWLVQALNRPVMESCLGYSAIGVYAVANKFPGIITIIFSLFSVSWNVSVFEEYGKPSFEAFYLRIFKLLFLFLTCGTICFSLSAPLIVKIFAAPDFFEAWKYMILLMVGAAISCMASFYATVFSVVKKSKYYFYSSIWGAASSIVANILLIPKFGLYGACASVVVSYAVMALSRYYYSLKFISVKLLKSTLIYIGMMLFAAICYLLIDGYLLKIACACISLFVICFFQKESFSKLMTFLKNRYCNK